MKIREWLKTRFKYSNERGFSLVETAVALLLLGGCVLTMVMGISTGAIAVQKNDQDVTAQGLARTQMEYIKDYPYDAGATTYPAVTAPQGYTIAVSVAAVPGATSDIQKVIATITRGGSAVFTLQDYKVNR